MGDKGERRKYWHGGWWLMVWTGQGERWLAFLSISLVLALG